MSYLFRLLIVLVLTMAALLWCFFVPLLWEKLYDSGYPLFSDRKFLGQVLALAFFTLLGCLSLWAQVRRNTGNE